MLSKGQKDLAFGIAILVFGLVYLGLTMQLPRKGPIDSATIPYILASLVTLLGIIQIIATARRGGKALTPAQPPATSEEAKANAACDVPAASIRPDYRTVTITVGLIVLYVALLDYLGFPLMSALYLFFQICVLTPSYMKRKYPLYAFIAITTSVGVFYLFRSAFDMMLPDGELWWRLGWL